MLFQLEVGNAVTQQPADAVGLFEQGHGMAGARQLLRGGKAGRAGAHHRNRLAGFPGGDLRMDPAFFPAPIHDLAFDGLDGDRIVLDVQGTGRLARRRAAPAGEFREIVGGMQRVRRRAPLVAIDQIVPVGDQIVDRAALVAEGNAAIHAARRLLAYLRRRQRMDEFAVIVNPRFRLFAAAVLAFDFQKARDLAHVSYSAAMAARALMSAKALA